MERRGHPVRGNKALFLKSGDGRADLQCGLCVLGVLGVFAVQSSAYFVTGAPPGFWPSRCDIPPEAASDWRRVAAEATTIADSFSRRNVFCNYITRLVLPRLRRAVSAPVFVVELGLSNRTACSLVNRKCCGGEGLEFVWRVGPIGRPQGACMRSRQAITWACAVALGMGAGLVGCSQGQLSSSAPRTPGEKIEMQGKQVEQAGTMRKKGEQMMVEGNGKRGQGQQLIAQGKTEEGQKMAQEGEDMVRQGQQMIEQSDQMRMNAMQTPVTTQPSMPAGGSQ